MKLLLALIVLFLCGCAAHTWAPGPGLSAADFEPAKARCSLLARHGDSGFVAVGSQSYVAGAALGHAIGEGVRANQDFNDCMLASGWNIADGQNAATQSVAVAQIKVAKDQLTSCVAAISNKPEYFPLLPHLADLSTARFTMAQLTDKTHPERYGKPRGNCICRRYQPLRQQVRGGHCAKRTGSWTDLAANEGFN